MRSYVCFEELSNTKGSKLCACFADFKKAFDSVIHPGLQAKLKELNINSKFNDTISNFHSKSKLCVSV